jgi:hypothetical protein
VGELSLWSKEAAPAAPNLLSLVLLRSSASERGSGELMRPGKRREKGGNRNGDRRFSFEGSSGEKEEGKGGPYGWMQK